MYGRRIKIPFSINFIKLSVSSIRPITESEIVTLFVPSHSPFLSMLPTLN